MNGIWMVIEYGLTNLYIYIYIYMCIIITYYNTQQWGANQQKSWYTGDIPGEQKNVRSSH